MSDNLQPTRYAECFTDSPKLCRSTKSYKHQFRVLVMELFMDHLSLEQIDKFFFAYELPARLKDKGRAMLRSEILTYINDHFLDTWRKTPSDLQDVLKTIGRPDLSTKVHELVESYPAALIVSKEAVPSTSQQEKASSRCNCSSRVSGSQTLKLLPVPVQESQRFVQAEGGAEDELHSKRGGMERASADQQGGAYCEADQPIARNSSTKLEKQDEKLEKILEDEGLSLVEERRRSNSLKRTASTASNASSRSSGYFSNPRSSNVRLSDASIYESIEENSHEEEDSSLLRSIKQTRKDSRVDDGLEMTINHTSEFVDSCESTGAAELSTSKVSPPCAQERVITDQDGPLEPVSRPRCYQLNSSTPIHKMKQLKQNEYTLEPSEMRKRSRSLPSNSRINHLHSTALYGLLPSNISQHSLTNSSYTSLDSDGLSEQSSRTGSQLSIASATSGHESRQCSLSRRTSPPIYKPFPVISEVTFSGSMKIKLKHILKLIERNDQNPLTSDKFPCVEGHRGPCYKIRFFPSNFSKEKSSALYIDVARSYLKKVKSKEQKQTIEIPAMHISVQLSYSSDGESCEGGVRREVKTLTQETDVKKIDCRVDSSKRVVIASFPQLVSHAELGLSEAVADGRSSLVIRVEMCTRSS